MSGWVPLADPISCPGVVDLLAIIGSRTWRDVPLASMLAAGNTTLLLLALLQLARRVHAVTSTVVITIAITVAAAASAEFAPALAPSPAAAFLITIAAWTAVLRARLAAPESVAPLGLALGLLGLLAATVTPFTIPVAILAGWLAWRYGMTRAGAAAVIVLAPSLVVQLVLPQGPSSATASYLSCVIPGGGLTSLLDAGRGFGSMIVANPLVAALAVLGLVAQRRLSSDVARSLVPMALVAFWGVAVMPEPSGHTMAPFVLVFWLLAAAGLTEVWEAASRTSSGRVGAVVLSIAVVALQIVSVSTRRDPNVPADGHERLTSAMMSSIVGALPRGAGLVAEDAVSDLLTRALPSRMRTSDRFHVVPLDASAITAALSHARVFALPRAQRVLQHLGFELADPGPAGAPGLAEVRQAQACTAELGSTPVDLPPMTDRQAFALVADDERARDSVVIVLAGDAPVPAWPVNWPPQAMRGFHGRMFDLTVAMDRRDFAEELRSYELSSWSVPNTRHMTRIEAWRTPGAPRVLQIALGGPANVGIARGLGTTPGPRLRICPSIPYDVRPLVRRP